MPCLIFLLTCWLIPESPVWLVKGNKVKEAKETLLYLRGSSYNLNAELDEIIALLDKNNNNNNGNGKPMSSCEKLNLMTTRRVLYPLTLLSLLFLLQVTNCHFSRCVTSKSEITVLQGFSGADTIHIYSLQIFKQAGIVLDRYLLAILTQAAFTACNYLSAFLITICLRRTQFICSGLVMSCSLLLIGCSLQQDDLSWAWRLCQPLLFLSVAFSYSCGYGTVTYSLGAELFPSEVKGLCTAIPLAVM